jgi:hypothetical protein
MQPFATSKLLTTLALTAGAAALSVLGISPAGAATATAHSTSPRPAHGAAPQPGAATDVAAAASVNGRVVSNLPLNIRAAATTNSAVLGSYAPGTIVHISCKVNGQVIDGNPRWYKLADRTGWVAARYVVNLGTVPWC